MCAGGLESAAPEFKSHHVVVTQLQHTNERARPNTSRIILASRSTLALSTDLEPP